jgi:hypothetical protein
MNAGTAGRTEPSGFERRRQVIDNVAARDAQNGNAIPRPRAGEELGWFERASELPSQRAHPAPPIRTGDDAVPDHAPSRFATPGRSEVPGGFVGSATVGRGVSGDDAVGGGDRELAATSSSWYDETMVLPTFVTGRLEAAALAATDAVTEAFVAPTPEAAVAAAEHAQDAARAQASAVAEAHAITSNAVVPAAGPDPDSDRLPSSERNMLIFVALLLALGTIAVVATMGVGRFG